MTNTWKMSELDIWAVESAKRGISYGELQTIETCMMASERVRVRMLEKFKKEGDTFFENRPKPTMARSRNYFWWR